MKMNFTHLTLQYLFFPLMNKHYKFLMQAI